MQYNTPSLQWSMWKCFHCQVSPSEINRKINRIFYNQNCQFLKSSQTLLHKIHCNNWIISRRKEDTKLHKNTVWIKEKAKKNGNDTSIYIFAYWYDFFALPNFICGKHSNFPRFCLVLNVFATFWRCCWNLP